MEIRFVPLDLARIDGLRYEAIVLPVHDDERPLAGAAGLCDWRLCGRLSRLLQRDWVKTRAGDVTLVPVRPRLPFDKMLLFGTGDSAGFSASDVTGVTARMLDTLTHLRLRTFVMALPGRAMGRVNPTDAIRGFMAAPGLDEAIDEVVIVDELDATRVMAPVVEAEKRRRRALRQDDED